MPVITNKKIITVIIFLYKQLKKEHFNLNSNYAMIFAEKDMGRTWNL